MKSWWSSFCFLQSGSPLSMLTFGSSWMWKLRLRFSKESSSCFCDHEKSTWVLWGCVQRYSDEVVTTMCVNRRNDVFGSTKPFGLSPPAIPKTAHHECFPPPWVFPPALQGDSGRHRNRLRFYGREFLTSLASALCIPVPQVSEHIFSCPREIAQRRYSARHNGTGSPRGTNLRVNCIKNIRWTALMHQKIAVARTATKWSKKQFQTIFSQLRVQVGALIVNFLSFRGKIWKIPAHQKERSTNIPKPFQLYWAQ